MSDGRIVCVFLLALPIIIQYFSRTSTCLYLVSVAGWLGWSFFSLIHPSIVKVRLVVVLLFDRVLLGLFSLVLFLFWFCSVFNLLVCFCF